MAVDDMKFEILDSPINHRGQYFSLSYLFIVYGC
ncbi:uncharacterized protein METZ01_LOCUS444217, partial [marine metagenome]